MAQPPSQPLMPREVTRGIPFVSCRTFLGTLGTPGGTVTAEFDTLFGYADSNQFNNVLNWPGTNVPKQHAVGPYLDAALFADQTTEIEVSYAVDRGCQYRVVATPSAIAANTFGNISGLRITGRFVRVILRNTSLAVANVEFGVYVRSA